MKKMATTLIIVATLLLTPGMAEIGPRTAPRISVEEARELMGKQGVVFVDVRRDRDWKSSDRMISGAVRKSYLRVENWVREYPRNTTFVVYCA